MATAAVPITAASKENTEDRDEIPSLLAAEIAHAEPFAVPRWQECGKGNAIHRRF
jgi:hypothetical protein